MYEASEEEGEEEGMEHGDLTPPEFLYQLQPELECVHVCDDYEDLNRYEENFVRNLVLVNFHMLGKYVFTHNYPYDTSIKKIKYDVANKIRIPEPHLQIMHWHVFLPDCATLEYIKTECRGFVDLTVVNTSTATPVGVFKMIIPDIITVHIPQDDDEFIEITVEIEDRRIIKPYVGGFRNKKTGIEYHHAFTQTGPPPEKVSPREKLIRDTQTIDFRHRRSEMMYSRATQMANENIWIPSDNDIILEAKKYETAEERAERIGYLRAVITIQRYYRRWKLNKALKALSAEYHRRLECEKRENRELLQDQEGQRKREIINKVFPRTRADFSMLYAMVDRWKKAHIERISKMHTTAAKLAEFYLLLNKEIEMLSVIEQQRHRIKQEMKIVDEIKFFDYISTPVKWTGYKGLKIAMDTLETQRGRVFQGVYYQACDHSVSTEERIKFITELSDKLKEHNCDVGNEIVELLEREIVLLQHGMDNKQLDMLHKRIQALLLKHYKMVSCNERVTKRMLRLKEEGMENDLFLCQRCETLKSNKDYPINHCNQKFTACTICAWNDRAAQPWIDIAPYRFILRNIRRDERKRSTPSSIIFIIQERDIYYLVERIWHAQSIINESKDLDTLRLVRWDSNEEWSPWNCILLTEEEAKSHLRVQKLEDVYDEEFRKIIISKHMFARCVFGNVLLLERSIKLAEEEEERNRPKPDPDELQYVNFPIPCTHNVHGDTPTDSYVNPCKCDCTCPTKDD